MTAASELLTRQELKKFAVCPVECPRVRTRVASLAEYFGVISGAISGDDSFWFRGHADVRWSLTPSALRFPQREQRTRALHLVEEFKRIADIKLLRPPAVEQELMWAQLAQHYGLPTRLLDWSESATAALYFAIQQSSEDGIVFILNPVDLNRLSEPRDPRILDPQRDRSRIAKYLSLSADARANGSFPIAINPMWNSERLIQQKGVFTIHGTRFSLDRGHTPSLVGIPILAEYKRVLRMELQRVGVDEMTLFPELEHACNHLKRRYGLGNKD